MKEAQAIIAKIQATETMPELDALRTETAEAMSKGRDVFHLVQGAFRKAKNRLRRVPMSKRTWRTIANAIQAGKGGGEWGPRENVVGP